MARQLWLLRHAEAEPHGSREDSKRRLTERGEQQARLAGAALVRIDVSFEAIVTSPKERALRTAQLAAEAFSEQQRALLERHAPLASGFDAAQALDLLAGTSADARVLAVGHEPDLSRVAGELCGGVVELKKGGLAAVRLHGGRGELVLLLRPAELALIAGEVPVGG